MKKLFLLILAGGIMITACKKENLKNENPKDYLFLNDSEWILNKSNVLIGSALCNEYKSKITGQIIYKAITIPKTNFYDRKAEIVNEFGKIDCPNQGDNCAVVYVDKKRALIIKDGTTVN